MQALAFLRPQLEGLMAERQADAAHNEEVDGTSAEYDDEEPLAMGTERSGIFSFHRLAMRLRQVCMNYVAVSACASASTTSGCQCLCNCLYHCQRPSEQAQAASHATSTEPNTTTRLLKTYRKSRPPREGLRGKTRPHSHREHNRATTHCAEASART